MKKLIACSIASIDFDLSPANFLGLKNGTSILFFFAIEAIFLESVLTIILSIQISCGFKPLHSQLKNQPDILGTLHISEIAGIEGYHLREELVKRFGMPDKDAYILHLNIETTKLNEVITPNCKI